MITRHPRAGQVIVLREDAVARPQHQRAHLGRLGAHQPFPEDALQHRAGSHTFPARNGLLAALRDESEARFVDLKREGALVAVEPEPPQVKRVVLFARDRPLQHQPHLGIRVTLGIHGA